MSFAAGVEIFNSCDKQGSIAKFTEHLRTHPNDYDALMWRSKAHDIVGNSQEALQDLQNAMSVSSGIKHDVAKGDYIRLSTNDLEQFGDHAKRTVDRYKNEWKAWAQLGHYNSMKKDESEAVRCWENALSLAKEHQETNDPEMCWIYFKVGNYFLNNGKVIDAKTYFTNAVETCPTHTMSHILLCLVNFLQDNHQEARENFKTASQLNQGLSLANFKTTNFDEFLQLNYVKESMEPLSLSRAPKSAMAKTSESSAAGGASGGPGGRSRGGGGSSDDDDEDVSAVWKRLQKEAPCIKRYGGHKYVQSKCGKYWYSRDTARHGGAQFKRYDDTGSTLRFRDSLDAKFNPMSGKHESRENTFISKSKMTGVKGK